MLGGASLPNHSATSRFLVFLLAMSPFHEIFRLPLSRGFYSQNWVFVQKQASVSPGRERFWAGRHHFGPPKINGTLYVVNDEYCPLYFELVGQVYSKS